MLDFNQLSNRIIQTHEVFQQQAAKSINKLLTVRNWLIGYFIFEFEQNGADRAAYGAQLITNLAQQINQRGLGATNLKLARQFYKTYSFLAPTIKQELGRLLPQQKSQLSPDLLLNNDYQPLEISQSVTDQLEIGTELFKATLKDLLKTK